MLDMEGILALSSSSEEVGFQMGEVTYLWRLCTVKLGVEPRLSCQVNALFHCLLQPLKDGFFRRNFEGPDLDLLAKEGFRTMKGTMKHCMAIRNSIHIPKSNSEVFFPVKKGS